MILKKTSNLNQDFMDLIQQLDHELADRYGVLQAAYNTHNVINPIDTAVVGYLDNLPVACGCFKKIDADTIEIKRMYVDKTVRRNGFSMLILGFLEKDWCECCYEHDKAYWQGRTAQQRLDADTIFRDCISGKTGGQDLI